MPLLRETPFGKGIFYSRILWDLEYSSFALKRLFYFKNQEKVALSARAVANRILKKSDLIKFAKAQALPETAEIASVRSFIKSTHENLNLGLYPN